MENLVVADEGERFLLDTTLSTPLAVSQTWNVHLYTNDYTPIRSVTLGDLVECSLPGYSAKPLTRSLWTPAITVGGQAQSQYGANPVLFPVTGGLATYYGFFVTTEDNAQLLWVQRGDAPAVIDPFHPGVANVVFGARSESEPT